MHRHSLRHLVLFVLFTVTACSLRADIRLPQVFGDHMVLQRDASVPVWGWATPGETVSVRLDDEAPVTVQANEQGAWRVDLPPHPAGGPHTLTVTGSNERVIQDILFGEVWLCSGQSNMQWTVHASARAKEEIAAANFPQIRHLAMPRTPSSIPVDDRDTEWKICAPATAGSFTAVGYFFGRFLHQELQVPIGLLNASWGGTLIEPWTPPEGFRSVPALADLQRTVEQATPTNPAFRKELTAYRKRMQTWMGLAETSLQDGSLLDPPPAYPEGLIPLTARDPGHQQPTALYNGMIHPLVPYRIQGAIWYQGESNHQMGGRYTDLKKGLVQGWREVWGQGEFPFYFVQIAPYTYGAEDPTILPVFWEAQQRAAREIPQSGIVVIHDVGNINNIHPANKQEVGRRLGLTALAKTYGRENLVYSGPTFRSMEVEGAAVRIHFDHVGGGLVSRDGQPLSHFELVGRGVGCVPAEAVIDGETVVVRSPGIPEPLGIRFGWHKTAEPNLMNVEGLPAAPFRAGAALDGDPLVLHVPEADDYELLYELDLAKLKKDITYDLDRRKELTGPFDRVAYLLELQQAQGDKRFVYVSMDAFTDRLDQLGIPTVRSGAHFQQAVTNLTVYANSGDLPTGSGIAGNIEFWPNNYASQNAARVPGAKDGVYDTGDEPAEPVDGYGCMQVHGTKAGKTLFAINKWSSGAQADLGIGNSEGKTRDWTFTGGASTYGVKRLRVLVRPVKQAP